MKREKRVMLRRFFNDKPMEKRRYNKFPCNKCDFTTWAHTRLVKHKREVHSY